MFFGVELLQRREEAQLHQWLCCYSDRGFSAAAEFLSDVTVRVCEYISEAILSRIRYIEWVQERARELRLKLVGVLPLMNELQGRVLVAAEARA